MGIVTTEAVLRLLFAECIFAFATGTAALPLNQFIVRARVRANATTGWRHFMWRCSDACMCFTVLFMGAVLTYGLLTYEPLGTFLESIIQDVLTVVQK